MRIGRRQLVLLGAAAIPADAALPPIVVRVQVLFDQGAHSGRGLGDRERAKFWLWQEKARREYAISGLRFDVQASEGAYLRTQGYSIIPDQFLVRTRINLFVTDSLRMDVDTQRTGGSSMGPQPSRPGIAGSKFYKIFLGLQDAGEATLPHEYAHHFTLDTRQDATSRSNHWADLRNDYWLWRQRHGVPIAAFRACAAAEWAGRGQ